MVLGAPGSLQAQLAGPRQGEQELIVLLAAGPEAPTPEEIVGRAARGEALPAGLAAGGPSNARFLITDRASGAARERLDADPDRPASKLQRYVVLRYPATVDLAAVKEALRKNPNVLHVGPNRRAKLSDTVPNDPFYSLQWGLPALHLPAAWDRQKGHAYVAVVDIGIDADHPDHRAFDGVGNWVGGNYRPFLSYDYGNGDPNPDTGEPQVVNGQTVNPTVAGHGTHVAGTVAANTDNGIGVAGVCWHCSLMISKTTFLEDDGTFNILQSNAVDSINGSIERGAQGITMSLGWRPAAPFCGTQERAPDCVQDPNDSLCVAIQRAHDHDVVITAASGNDGSAAPDFPANDDRVLGAAGIQSDGQLWNDCSSPSCECGGSNYDPNQFNTPAKDIQSTFYIGLPYAPPTCDDSGLPPNGDGYGPCTGTSMAAPHLAGVAGILRSTNPLLGKDDIENLLETNLDNPPGWNPSFGRGKPDTRAALDDALGRVDGQVLANRLTPLFELYSSDAETHLSTTVPQMAAAALNDGEVSYFTEGRVPLVPGYARFPGTRCIIGPCIDLPRAYVYVFSSDVPPFPGAPQLVPLYRMGFDQSFGGNPENRSFFYTTETAGLELGKSIGYDHLGIEGYIYPRCTPEPSCMPAGAVRLYRLYHVDRDDYALFPESELAYFQSQGYISQPSLNDWIGYVYPNADADGDDVVDGFEDLIGTDPQVADTDGDGLDDGQEILEYPYSDPCTGGCAGEQVIGEVGIVTVNHNPKTVVLSRSYSKPVVIARPPSINGSHTSVVRITSVQSDRFTLYIHEAPNMDGAHTNEQVSYVVLEAGRWQLADGTDLEVNAIDTSATVGHRVANQWQQVNFQGWTAGTPTVLTQVQSNKNPHWVKTRQRSTTSSGFQVALEEEEAATVQHGPESIGWVAIEPGTGTWSGLPYAAAQTPNAVTHAVYSIAFGTNLGASPRFVGAMMTYDGGHNAALRYRNLTATGVDVNVEEDTTWDAEVSHTTEVVGYLALGGNGQLLAQPR